jgi:hypothetical protein
MAKVKKLNSSIILQEYSKEFIQKQVIITVGGKDYEVLVDQKFRNTVLQTMVLEALNNYKYLEGLDEGVKLSYYMFQMIKHFTDIDIAKTDNFEDQIRVLNAMIDLGIFETITNAFPENEINKASEFIKKFGKRIEEFVKENKNLDEVKKMIESEIKESDE